MPKLQYKACEHDCVCMNCKLRECCPEYSYYTRDYKLTNPQAPCVDCELNKRGRAFVTDAWNCPYFDDKWWEDKFSPQMNKSNNSGYDVQKEG